MCTNIFLQTLSTQTYIDIDIHVVYPPKTFLFSLCRSLISSDKNFIDCPIVQPRRAELPVLRPASWLACWQNGWLTGSDVQWLNLARCRDLSTVLSLLGKHVSLRLPSALVPCSTLWVLLRVFISLRFIQQKTGKQIREKRNEQKYNLHSEIEN